MHHRRMPLPIRVELIPSPSCRDSRGSPFQIATTLQLFMAVWQRMRLQIVHHLQLVFDIP